MQPLANHMQVAVDEARHDGAPAELEHLKRLVGGAEVRLEVGRGATGHDEAVTDGQSLGKLARAARRAGRRTEKDATVEKQQ